MSRVLRLVGGLVSGGAVAVLLLSSPSSYVVRAAQPPPSVPPAVSGPVVAWEPPPNPLRQRVDALPAAAFLLIDLDRDLVIDARDAGTARWMASLTKIATALTAREVAPLQKRIAIGEAAPRLEYWDETTVGLRVGEEYSLEELLYAMMLPSGNDAARAIAAGTLGEAAFVRRMNALSQRLGLTAHFDSPVGLKPGDLASARDLGVLGARLLADPVLAQIVATREFVLPRTATHPAHKWGNLNALLERYPGATGIKTGWTEWSGPCLVASATRDDRHLLVVLLNAPAMFEGAAALFDWGYSLPLRTRESAAE